MKRVIFVVMICLLATLIFASVAFAQETTPMAEATPPGGLAPSGGPAIILPAAALLLGSGILTYAILRRR